MQRLLNMWKQNNNQLIRAFEFKSFAKAAEFVYASTLFSISAEHIPFWEDSVHLVIVKLNTNRVADTISDNEKKLAEQLEEIYSNI